MKKRLFTLLLVLLSFVSYSQTIVSTEPQNKNVVLEQYTGINCGFCPDGATIANNIFNDNPGRVVVIAVHAGGFSNPSGNQPDFRTTFGTPLLNQTGITGFPAGTINRTVFAGLSMTAGGTGMGRQHWVNASNQILAQAAYLNVGAEAEIDLTTREITVNVEVYYTDDSPVGTNKLNVVLLQDKTYAYQAGGGANYEHNNRLVHMLSGQWGSDITTTTQGSLHEESFLYTIPSDYNNILAELHNMRVAVFVAEDTQKIINGLQITPSFVNMPELEYAIVSNNTPANVWDGRIIPEFSVLSLGETITSLDIEYYVNDEEVETYNWTGAIEFSQTEVIILPEISFNLLLENTLYVNILNDDSTPDDNSFTANFTKAPATGNGDLVVQVRTDQWGSETTWNIKTEAGSIVANGGPYSNAINTHNHDISLPYDNYTLTVFDSYGDGIISGGYIRILDDGVILVNIPGNSFSTEASRLFSVVTPANITFNPENGEDNVANDASFTISSSKAIYDHNFELLTNDDVASVITLKENNAAGEDIPFNAIIEDNSVIIIDPVATIADGTIVYLGLNAFDEDFVAINESIVFMIGEDFTINISAEAYPSDGGSITGSGVYWFGEEVTLTASPENGYYFVKWSENGSDILDEGEVYVFDAYENRHLVAHFELEDDNNIFESAVQSISVYPNPAYNELFITLPEGITEADLRLFNQLGQLVFTGKLSGNTNSINVHNLTNGLYLLEIIGEKFHVNQKVLINK